MTLIVLPTVNCNNEVAMAGRKRKAASTNVVSSKTAVNSSNSRRGRNGRPNNENQQTGQPSNSMENEPGPSARVTRSMQDEVNSSPEPPRVRRRVIRAEIVEDQDRVAIEVEGSDVDAGSQTDTQSSDEESSEEGEVDFPASQPVSENNNATLAEARVDTTDVDYEDDMPSDDGDARETSGDEMPSASAHVRVTAAKTRRSESSRRRDEKRTELATIKQSFAQLQSLMQRGGYFDDSGEEENEGRRGRRRSTKKRAKEQRKKDKGLSDNPIVGIDSETTIYRNAVKRASSSSEGVDIVNTSDETISPPQPMIHDRDRESNRFLDGLISEYRRRSETRDRDPGPHRQSRPLPTPPRAVEGRDRARQAIREAEAAKARILDVAGNGLNMVQPGCIEGPGQSLENQFAHSMLVDESYLMVSSHLDQNICDKIRNGEYVDFAKLLQKDRLETEEDNRMITVNKGGYSYFQPLSDRFKIEINSIERWNKAFRVFSQVHSNKFPDRAVELIQYSHVIHTAAKSYIWDNVYSYDRRFRLHMANHPSRSWAIILQQAWSIELCVKQAIKSPVNLPDSKPGSAKGKVCYKYNRGKCSYGFNCRFEHKCGVCGKTGHGSHNCRRLSQYDSQRNSGDRSVKMEENGRKSK